MGGPDMVLFLFKRCLRAAAAMLICLTAVFILLRVAGDPAAILLPPETPPSVRAEYREMWGLDRSLPEQFALYLRSAVRGDLGVIAVLPGTVIFMTTLSMSVFGDWLRDRLDPTLDGARNP